MGASEQNVSAGDAMDVEVVLIIIFRSGISACDEPGTAEARTSAMGAVTLANLEILVSNFDRSEKGKRGLQPAAARPLLDADCSRHGCASPLQGR